MCVTQKSRGSLERSSPDESPGLLKAVPGMKLDSSLQSRLRFMKNQKLGM
jgi:hypothetical protein